MAPELREYQLRDLLQVRHLFRKHRSVLLVQPTGAGKGFLAAYMVRTAKSRDFRVLFLVNRRTLVNDMCQRVGRMGLEYGVIMGNDRRTNMASHVQIASIDTINRREFTPPAELLIIDEAHFALSPTWMQVVARYPEAKKLGMTATPIRTDGRGLGVSSGGMFEAMVPGPSVADLIAQQYLVPAVVFCPEGAPSVEGVDKIGGEFNNKQLAAICDKPKLVGDVVEQWKKHAPDRKTAAFGVNQHHALEIAEKFRCAGIDWAYVDADTPDAERDRIWRDFDNGGLRGVASVGVISYGWDHPICSCIIGARATASVGLWRQILGRGSRPYPGKTNFYVLDHFNNTGLLNVLFDDPVEWSLDGKAIKDTGADEGGSITLCRVCFATFRSGPAACPYCGSEIPKKPRLVETVEGELEEFRRQQKETAINNWRERTPAEEKRAKYEEFKQIAKMRGYKPTWPAVRFHIVYGMWPPDEWRRNNA